jgi:hypothetical protein
VVSTSEQVVEFARSRGMTIYHTVAAVMDPKDDDVIAPDLCICGAGE